MTCCCVLDPYSVAQLSFIACAFFLKVCSAHFPGVVKQIGFVKSWINSLACRLVVCEFKADFMEGELSSRKK